MWIESRQQETTLHLKRYLVFDTLNTNTYTRCQYLVKTSNNICKSKHLISTIIIRGSYMFEYSVSKDMRNKLNEFTRREVTVGRVATHLCLTLIVKELRISVE